MMFRSSLALAFVSVRSIRHISSFLAPSLPMAQSMTMASTTTTTATTAIEPPSSFYRRELPPTCIALSSTKGKAIFRSSMQNGGLKSFFSLMEQFSTQSEPAFCGLSTLMIVLNALSVDPRRTWKGPWRWYEETMLNCCLDLEEVKKTGITLKMFATLAKCQGLVVDLRYAEDATVDDFRAAVREACEEPADTEQQQQQDTMVRQRGPLLVVSYNRGVLQQTGTGHFSPIAAYDGATDRVLVLDTARFKYGSHWVDLSLLFRAMQPVDPDTNKSRGFALLSFEEQPEMGDSLPVSILVRTQKSQSPLRRLYKELLVNLEKEQEGPVTWEQVYDYWTLQGKDLEYVWKVMEPQVIPMDPDAEKQVDNVRLLLQELIPSVGGKEYKTPGCCRGNINRRLTLTDEEGIFLLYLASLSEDDRERAVNPQKATTTTEAQKQLLAEAALIQYAIETSDMMD